MNTSNFDKPKAPQKIFLNDECPLPEGALTKDF